MRLRYKKTLTETSGSHFNMCALNEVETGDDTVPVPDLDVFLNGEWKDLSQAFKDRDVITDNYNTHFFVPRNEEEKSVDTLCDSLQRTL